MFCYKQIKYARIFPYCLDWVYLKKNNTQIYYEKSDKLVWQQTFLEKQDPEQQVARRGPNPVWGHSLLCIHCGFSSGSGSFQDASQKMKF